MPGSPVSFEDKTIIFISGNSGIGKSTLATFLSDDRHDVKHLSLDSIFTVHSLESYKSLMKTNNKYEETIKLFKSIQDPYAHVSSIVSKINKAFLLEYVYIVIKNKFKDKEKMKLLVIEGYCLSFIKKQLNKKLIKKDYYRVWWTEPIL